MNEFRSPYVIMALVACLVTGYGMYVFFDFLSDLIDEWIDIARDTIRTCLAAVGLVAIAVAGIWWATTGTSPPG